MHKKEKCDTLMKIFLPFCDIVDNFLGVLILFWVLNLCFKMVSI